jgi:hypothetical protein
MTATAKGQEIAIDDSFFFFAEAASGRQHLQLFF